MKQRLAILACVMGMTLTFQGCNDGIEVRQNYDFSIFTWPLPETVKSGEEVEIRFTLKRDDIFQGADYSIQWVQNQGKGEVTDRLGMYYIDREEYELSLVAGLDTSDPSSYGFTLYYRSTADKKSEVTFIVKDNFGLRRELTVTFDTDKTN